MCRWCESIYGIKTLRYNRKTIDEADTSWRSMRHRTIDEAEPLGKREAQTEPKALLNMYLPKFVRKLKEKWQQERVSPRSSKECLLDERTDLLATMLALYPNTPTKELAEEFMLEEKSVIWIAHKNGVYKSDEERRRICIENGRDAFLRKYWTQYFKGHPRLRCRSNKNNKNKEQ